MPIIEQFFINQEKQPLEMFHKKGVCKNSAIFTGQESSQKSKPRFSREKARFNRDEYNFNGINRDLSKILS